MIGFSGPSGPSGASSSSGAPQKLTFGTTGRLVNSNLLMYDVETCSEWPQLLGTAISGPLKGTRLDTVPLVWTTWGHWRAAHPDTRCLLPPYPVLTLVLATLVWGASRLGRTGDTARESREVPDTR